MATSTTGIVRLDTFKGFSELWAQRILDIVTGEGHKHDQVFQDHHHHSRLRSAGLFSVCFVLLPSISRAYALHRVIITCSDFNFKWAARDPRQMCRAGTWARSRRMGPRRDVSFLGHNAGKSSRGVNKSLSRGVQHTRYRILHEQSFQSAFVCGCNFSAVTQCWICEDFHRHIPLTSTNDHRNHLTANYSLFLYYHGRGPE